MERLDPAPFAAGRGDRLDSLLVVRDALAPSVAERVLRRVRREETRLTIDLDDDLLSTRARMRLVRQGYEPSRLDTLAQLVAAADGVLVSTPFLQVLVQEHGGRSVDVVRNELDPLLWARELEPVAPAPDNDELRILYMGSRTHQPDLELLDGVVEQLTAHLDRPAVLEVVGITGSDLPAGARRLVPDRARYPGFVRWLRRHQQRWRAGVAPLAEDSFNLAKSDLKLLEYAALDLPCVATPFGPYATAEPILASGATTRAQWVHRLAESMGASAPRSSARDWVLKNRTITQTSTDRWLELLTGGAIGAAMLRPTTT